MRFLTILLVLLFARFASAAIELTPGPYLFLDDALIESQANIERVTNHPQKLDRPIITGKEDHNYQPYVTVLRDPQTKIFKVWYGVPAEKDTGDRSHLAYMESKDGIHWNRPPKILADPKNHPIRFGASVIDDAATAPADSRGAEARGTDRYKFAYYCGPATNPPTGGLMIANSPDGLTWTPITDKICVLPHDHDINNLFHDTARDRYLATISTTQSNPDWFEKRRIPFQSESKDLLHWSTPWQVLTPQPDEGDIEFYAMSAYLQRGQTLVGFAKVLYNHESADPDGPKAGIGYSTLVWSHDGQHWQRDKEPFLDRSQTKGDWDHAMAWADCQLPVNDEIYIYYGGYKQGHKINRKTERQIGLARIKQDRYIARQSKTKGTLITKPLVLQAADLTINANIQGQLQLRILDDQSHPIPNFDFKDIPPIKGDSIAHAIKWKQPLTQLQGKTVRLEFQLQNAALYAITLK